MSLTHFNNLKGDVSWLDTDIELTSQRNAFCWDHFLSIGSLPQKPENLMYKEISAFNNINTFFKYLFRSFISNRGPPCPHEVYLVSRNFRNIQPTNLEIEM